MQSGQHRKVNSKESLQGAIDQITQEFAEHKYGVVTCYFGKRTLPQNSLKSIWYGEIAKRRGDVTAKEVERECKLTYGIPILRRQEMHNWVYEKSLDLLDYERKLKIMDSFSVTSIMSVKELTEYMNEMKQQYSYLDSNKAK